MNMVGQHTRPVGDNRAALTDVVVSRSGSSENGPPRSAEASAISHERSCNASVTDNSFMSLHALRRLEHAEGAIGRSVPVNTLQHSLRWLQTAAREHWLALVILVAPINWVVYQSDKAENAIPMLPLPIIAFVIGLVLRPRHVWLVWLGSVVIQWIVMGVWGKYNDPGEETALSLITEAFMWMLMGVLIPVWLGRIIRAEIKNDQHPSESASA
jgi:hypothetical protein